MNMEPILLSFLILSFLVQAGYWLGLFRRLGTEGGDVDPGKVRGEESFTVLICARNEAENLLRHLPSVLAQDMPVPGSEVLVVNDASTDDTSVVLSGFSKAHPALTVVEMEKKSGSGKKEAFSAGVRAARNERIVVTDADCSPASKGWARRMAAPLGKGVGVVLGFAPYRRKKGCLNKLIRFETLLTALRYLSAALSGRGYMGVGRNMAFSGSLFRRLDPFHDNWQVPSGDDDLFVDRAMEETRPTIVLDPSAWVWSVPQRRWKSWWRQKKRHLQAGSHYKPGSKLITGLYDGSASLFFLACLGCFFYEKLFFIALFAILSRFLFQIGIFNRTALCMGQRDLLPWTMVLEIILLPLLFSAWIGGLITRKGAWV